MNRYYQILGLKPGASKAEVKRAYRKLALKYHPDVYKGENGQAKFVEITEAYQVLTEGKVKQVEQKPHHHSREESLRKAREKARADMRRKYSEFKKKQEEEENEQFRVALYIFIGIIATVITASLSVSVYHKKQAYTNSDTTICRVVSLEQHSFRVLFSDGFHEHVTEHRASKAYQTLYYKNGMPLQVGQEFMIVYNKAKPKYSQVEGDLITERTLLSYHELTAPKIKRWLTKEGRYYEGMEHCVFQRVYQRIGIEGLAQLFYYDEALIENLDNNTITFSSFKNQNEFQKILKECEFLYK